jgi:hypothetical protein
MLIEAGDTPRELGEELGFGVPTNLIKYDPHQPRACRPEATARAASGRNAAGPALIEGRSAERSLIERRSAQGQSRSRTPQPYDRCYAAPGKLIIRRNTGNTFRKPY